MGSKEYHKAYGKKYYVKNRQFLLDQTKEWQKHNPEKVIWTAARKRAKTDNMEFNIGVEDIVIPTHCPILGIELFKNGNDKDNAPSIDRIDNTKGYIKGNVCIMSYKANRIKNDGTAEEHLKIAEFMMAKLKEGTQTNG